MSRTSEWRIPSSNGFAEIIFDAQGFYSPSCLVEFKVSMTGKHWSRPGLLADPPEFERVVDDYDLVLSSVLVSKAACEDLCNDFGAWLMSHAPFARTLCSRPDQEFAIQVGTREGYEATLDHPILACTYSGGCGIEVFFVIDESCVRIARDGLIRVLRSVTESEKVDAGLVAE